MTTVQYARQTKQRYPLVRPRNVCLSYNENMESTANSFSKKCRAEGDILRVKKAHLNK